MTISGVLLRMDHDNDRQTEADDMTKPSFPEPDEHFFSSWRTAAPGFEDALERLRSAPVRSDADHRLINSNNAKCVWRCRDGAFDFASKTQDGKTPWRYLFRHSLPVRECLHYRILAELDIPVPEILAVGDTRRCFILKESFLATRYLDNTCDGRVFMPGGDRRTGHDALRAAFCEGHLRYLARLHDAGYFHKAFHPRNLLFRETGDETAPQLFWIDVARLRKSADARRTVIVDLHTFFRDMLLPEAEVKRLIGIYIAARRTPCADAEQIFSGLVTFKRRAFSKKTYRIAMEQEEGEARK